MRTLVVPVVRNVSWLLAGDLAVRGAMVAVVAIVGRTMGPAAVGVLSIALAVVMLAVPFGALGQIEVLIRATAGRPAVARSWLAVARRDQRRAALVLVPVAAAVLLALPDRRVALVVAAFVPHVLLRVAVLTRGAVFRGLDRMDVEVKARLIEGGVALAGVAAAVALGAPLAAVGLAYSAGAAAGYLWIRRQTVHLPGAPESAAEAPVPVPPAPRSLVVQALPFLAAGVVFQLLLRVDTLLLAGFGIGDEEIGYFGAAAVLVWGMLAAAQLLAGALYPTFSRHAAGLDSRPAAAAAAGLAVGLVPGAILAALAGLLARPLVGLLYGPELLPAVPVLERLVWALPAASAAMVLGTVLAAWHRQTRGLAALTGAFLLLVGLDLAWIPRAGILGAAAAAIAAHWANAAANLALAAWPRRRAGGVGRGTGGPGEPERPPGPEEGAS